MAQPHSLRLAPRLLALALMPALVLALVLGASRPGVAHAADAPPPLVAEQDVHVLREGERFTVDVVMHAPVTPVQAFAVLVDFEHMASFIPNLSSSEVLSRSGSLLTVRQKGVVRWGVLALSFDSLRELQLTPPHEIHGRAIGGSFKHLDTAMRLDGEPGGTQLHYHAEGEPGDWFPPLIGPALVQHETAEQFSAMLQEMVRRR